MDMRLPGGSSIRRGRSFRLGGHTLSGAARLEDRGWIEAEWGLSANNRRAKFYQLTVDGRRELAERITNYNRFAEAVERVIQAVPNAG